jgi:hypothetical protein
MGSGKGMGKDAEIGALKKRLELVEDKLKSVTTRVSVTAQEFSDKGFPTDEERRAGAEKYVIYDGPAFPKCPACGRNNLMTTGNFKFCNDCGYKKRIKMKETEKL